MTLAERITTAREAKGISQVRLAKMLGIAPSNVSRWESGKYEPQRETLISIADATGCDLEWLATGREPPPTPPPLSPDERTILAVYRSLGLTESEAIQGLTWAAGQRPVAPSVGTRVVAVRDETGLYEREEAERQRREREAARARSSAKKPDKTL
jgi:transcriptional regulator with XRE-family HTH domain